MNNITFIVVTDTDETTSIVLSTDFIISAAPIPDLSGPVLVQSGIPKGAKTAIRLKNMMNVYCNESFEDVVKLLKADAVPGTLIKTDRAKVVEVNSEIATLDHLKH